MEGLKPPKKLDFESKNLAEAWKRWRQELELYVDLSLDEEDETQKIKLLKYVIGPQGREIHDTFKFEKDPKDLTLADVIGKYESYCNPKKNETVERYKFNTRVQEKSETFEKFLTDLKILAATCNFDKLKDSMIRDRIVVGINDAVLRERLLREIDLTLDKAVQICRASELSKERSQTIASGTVQEVHSVRPKKVKSKTDKPSYNKEAKQKIPQPIKQCKYCGKSHQKQNCPAYGKICNFCKRYNHFESVCQKKRKQNVHQLQAAASLDMYDDSSDDEYFEIKTIQLKEVNSVENSQIQYSRRGEREILATMSINEKPVKFQVDTGASCNIICEKFLTENQLTNLEKTNQVLKMYNKENIIPRGKLNLKMINPRNHKKYKAEFVVIDNNECNPIIGINAAQQMDLLTIRHENIYFSSEACEMNETLTEENILENYADVFNGTGCLDGKYHLHTDPDVKPVIQGPRRIPVSLRDKLKNELERLESDNIIAKVEQPTKWVSNLVVVEKPNKLRVCLDPQHLNTALLRSHYPIPTVDEILPDLTNAKVFSTVDAKNGFWHVELDQESSLLTTFNTPFGRYRWCRMPFGIKTASEEFQRRQNEVVEGLPGVHSVVDDILIYGEGETEEYAMKDHDRKFHALMERCRERNLKLNPDKLKLKRKELRFVGHLISQDGLKPDPDKIKAVQDMSRPEDVTGVRSFLSFVTYLSRFLPKLSEISEPLRKLTRNDTEWEWSNVQEKAFIEIKQLITAEPVLRYYDAKKKNLYYSVTVPSSAWEQLFYRRDSQSLSLVAL